MTDINDRFGRIQRIVEKFEKELIAHVHALLEFVDNHVDEAAKEEFSHIKRILQAAIKAVHMEEKIDISQLRDDLLKIEAEDTQIEKLTEALVKNPDSETISHQLEAALKELEITLKKEQEDFAKA